MFGLTFEKLLLIAVIAAFILGPERLPLYAEKLGALVRSVRGFADTAKVRMAEELGPDFDQEDWKKLDPRQYDPRRIVRDALTDDLPGTSAGEHVPVADDSARPVEGRRTSSPVGAVAAGGWQEAMLSRLQVPSAGSLPAPSPPASRSAEG